MTALICSLLALSACGGGSSSSAPITTTPVPTLRSTATAKGILMGTAADAANLGESQYTSTLSSQYSQLEAENEMKFQFIHPRPNTDPNPYDFTTADSLVSFATNNSMVVRGHCFVWHQEVADWVTDGIADGSINAAALNGILQDHITTVGGHYGGKVWAWDVVNEALNDDGSMRSTLWYDQPGIGFAGQGTKYIEQALDWAHAADPKAKLFYNDYGAETLNSKSDAIYAMAQDFKTRGVPLDGIGFQFHTGGLGFDNAGNLNSIAQNFTRFSNLGMQIHITELDIPLSAGTEDNFTAQAKLYKEIVLLCTQNTNCKVIQTWGFTDKYSWIPSFTNNTEGWALPFDNQYNAKPAVQSMLDGLNGK